MARACLSCRGGRAVVSPHLSSLLLQQNQLQLAFIVELVEQACRFISLLICLLQEVKVLIRSRSPYSRSVSISKSRSRSRSRSQNSSDAKNPGNKLYVTGLLLEYKPKNLRSILK